jgi:hypothetical protein
MGWEGRMSSVKLVRIEDESKMRLAMNHSLKTMFLRKKRKGTGVLELDGG